MMPEPGAGGPAAGESDGFLALLARIVDLVARILRGEAALARAEAKRALRDAAFGIAQVIVAAILGFIGLFVLAAAAVLGLVALGLAPALAALAVGVALLLAAAGVLQYALRLLSPRNLVPRRSIDSLRRDVETFRNAVKSDGTSDF